MNIFWVLALAITSIGGLFLAFFFIASIIPKGTKIAPKIGLIIFKVWIPILACSGIFILLLVQDIGAVRHNQRLYQNAKGGEGDDNLFFHAAELFRVERNVYILILGLTVLIGVLLISWQAHSWSIRNSALQAKIQHAQ